METLLDIVLSLDAPAPIGPYSQAIRTRDFLFCSGQIALDPATGELQNATIEEETRQVLKNLRGILAASDATFANVAKTTIFLTAMADFAAVNKIYEEM